MSCANGTSKCNTSLGSLWPDDIYFRVGGTQTSGNPFTLPLPGDSLFTLPAIFKGWKIRINRNNTPLDYLDQGLGDSYFDYDPVTRVVSLSMAVNLDEKFMIEAYKPVA